MARAYRKAMDGLYLFCVIVAGSALVLISAVIPWTVYTRYVLNSAASWPEPMAVLLTIVLTFIGAASCYRRGLHMNVGFFVGMLPARLRRAADLLVEMLMALMALFMVIWGSKLVDATWHNTISEVEVPRRLVTLFALSKTGFLIRQRKSTVMLQLFLRRRPFQALLTPRLPPSSEPRPWTSSCFWRPCLPASCWACRSPTRWRWRRSPGRSSSASRSKPSC